MAAAGKVNIFYDDDVSEEAAAVILLWKRLYSEDDVV
jgi:hypothetical protein